MGLLGETLSLGVPTFLHTVKAVGGFLDRAARHCAETHADPDDFVHVRSGEKHTTSVLVAPKHAPATICNVSIPMA
jgi:hypothetical protein